jgi:pantetheine-phosphate adenylyltransferase
MCIRDRNGHLDIIKRASHINKEIIVAILNNSTKKPLFSLDERIQMLKKVTADIEGVRIESFDGLLMDYAEKVGASALVRGLRTISDFDYEFRMAALNKQLNNKIETIFIMAGTEYSYISSSSVKEIGLLGGDISKMIPNCLKQQILNKFKGDI